MVGGKDVLVTRLLLIELVSSWEVLLWNGEGLSRIDEIWVGELWICLSP